MIDVVLINPSEFIPEEVFSPGYHWKQNGKTRLREAPHLGLLYIAAVLESGGFQVKVLESNECANLDSIYSNISNNRPRIIGISSTTPTFIQAVRTAEFCKKHFPNSTIVLGGYHPTYFHREILESYNFVDIVVRGEGEFPMLEIVMGKPLNSIKGITYRENGRIITNEPCEPIHDLDILPMPARHLIKNIFDGGIEGMFRLTKPGEFSTILSSRGCPFTCKFCVAAGAANGGFRQRGVDSVVQEIFELAEQGIKFIQIQDMNFILNEERVKKICEAFRLTGIKWACLGRLDKVSEDLYKEMYSAGCRFVSFGIESGSQKILDYYNKRITLNDIKTGVKIAKRVGFDVIATLIVGAPIETFDDVKETLNLVIGLDIDFISVCRLNIFPYTPIWIDAHNQGLICDDKWNNDLTVSDVFTNPSKEETLKWQRYITNGFYTRKSYMIKQIIRTITKRKDLAKMNIPNVWRILSDLKTGIGSAN